MSKARKARAASEARRKVVSVTDQLAALQKMTVGQLREKYREVFGDPTRSGNKDYLRKKVAWRIQELAEGGISDRARSRIEELAAEVLVRRRSSSNGNAVGAGTVAVAPQNGSRDPRLPEPGTVITRRYKGAEHRVTVLEEGFEYLGERFASLSKVARQIAQTNWNGFLFFGLQRRTKSTAGEAGT